MEVQSSLGQLADNSRQLSGIAREVTERGRMTQSDRTVQVATAINELGSIVNEIARNAENAAVEAMAKGQRQSALSTQLDNLVGRFRL